MADINCADTVLCFQNFEVCGIVGKTDADLQNENARLKKELEELKNANEILKDALSFFAVDRKK